MTRDQAMLLLPFLAAVAILAAFGISDLAVRHRPRAVRLWHRVRAIQWRHLVPYRAPQHVLTAARPAGPGSEDSGPSEPCQNPSKVPASWLDPAYRSPAYRTDVGELATGHMDMGELFREQP